MFSKVLCSKKGGEIGFGVESTCRNVRSGEGLEEFMGRVNRCRSLGDGGGRTGWVGQLHLHTALPRAPCARKM